MTRVLNSQEYKALRTLLVAAREQTGITQAELADRLGRTQSFVSKYELGERRIDVVDFILICNSLDADAAAILRSLQGNR